MKIKNLIIGSAFASLFFLVNCGLPEAKCHLINENVDVVIDNRLLDHYEEGDTFWAEKSQSSFPVWEVTEDGYVRDTSFIFESQAGPYEKTIRKAIVVEKF